MMRCRRSEPENLIQGSMIIDNYQQINQIKSHNKMQELQVIFFERNHDVSLLERYQKVSRAIHSSNTNTTQPHSHLDLDTSHEKARSINKHEQSSVPKSSRDIASTDTFELELEKIPKKFEFQEKERLRVQRENWILKIIKSAKNVNDANLQQIHQISVDMMKYYDPSYLSKPKGEKEKVSTTEGIINLFIDFYSRHRESELGTIKKIIRPNNKFIVFDLIKQLVETHRQYFKVKLLQTFKEGPKNQVQKIKNPLPESQEQSVNGDTSKIIESQAIDNKETTTPINKLNARLWPQIEAFLDQYHLTVINSIGTPTCLKQSVNSLYNELLNLNHNRGVQYSISKYFEKCWDFGHRGQNIKFKDYKTRGYNYDISKLYTQQEINGINRKLEDKIQNNQIAIKKFENQIYMANTDPTKIKKLEPSQDLQQFFKATLDTQFDNKKLNENKLRAVRSSLPTPTLEEYQVNKYIPLIIKRYLGEYYRLELYIVYNQQITPISEFESKYGTSIKSYFKAYRTNKSCLTNRSNNDNKSKKSLQIIRPFKKHKFFSINRSKVKQLLSEEVLSRLFSDPKKKQSIFPMLRSNQLKQQELLEINSAKKNSRSLNQIRNRTISQQKLVPLFKNELLSHKIEAEQCSSEYYEYKNLSKSKASLEPLNRQQDSMKKSQIGTVTEIKELYSLKMGHNRKVNQSLELGEDQKKKKIDNIIESILNQRNLKLQ